MDEFTKLSTFGYYLRSHDYCINRINKLSEEYTDLIKKYGELKAQASKVYDDLCFEKSSVQQCCCHLINLIYIEFLKEENLIRPNQEICAFCGFKSHGSLYYKEHHGVDIYLGSNLYTKEEIAEICAYIHDRISDFLSSDKDITIGEAAKILTEEIAQDMPRTRQK